MKLNRALCTFSIRVLQYSAEQKGNFMLKIFSINPVLFIRMKDWSEDTFSNAVLGPGLHTCLKFRACSCDRLGLYIEQYDDFFPILRQANALCAWPESGPQHPSAGLNLPSQSKQSWGLASHTVQAELQLALLEAHLRSLFLSRLSAQPPSQGLCSSLFTCLASFVLALGVSRGCPR